MEEQKIEKKNDAHINEMLIFLIGTVLFIRITKSSQPNWNNSEKRTNVCLTLNRTKASIKNEKKKKLFIHKNNTRLNE